VCKKRSGTTVIRYLYCVYWIKCPDECRINTRDSKVPIHKVMSAAIHPAWAGAFVHIRIHGAKHKSFRHLLVVGGGSEAEFVSVLAEMNTQFHWIRKRHGVNVTFSSAFDSTKK
jgi:hypothetical protein